MRLPALFLFIFLALSLASKLQPLNVFSSVNDEFVTPELLARFQGIKESTLNLIKVLLSDDPVFALYKERCTGVPLMYEYMSVSAFLKIGEFGTLSPYPVYRTVDRMLSIFFVGTPEKEFDKNFGKRLKDRNKAHEKALQNKEHPELINSWARSLLEIHKMAASQMRRSVNHYEDMCKHYFATNGLMCIYELALQNVKSKSTGTPSEIWREKMVFMEENHLGDLIRMMEKGVIPEDASKDFILFIGSFADSSFKPTLLIDITSRNRELMFMRYGDDRAKPANYKTLPPSIVSYMARMPLVIGDRIQICNNMLQVTIAYLSKYWNDPDTNKNKRLSVIHIMNSVRFFSGVFADLQQSVKPRTERGKDCLQFDKVVGIYAIVMEIVEKRILVFLPQKAQSTYKSKFPSKEIISVGFSRNLPAAFDTIEATLLEMLPNGNESPLDVSLIQLIYRYLELSRSVVIMTEIILQSNVEGKYSTDSLVRRQFTAATDYLNLLLKIGESDILEQDSNQLALSLMDHFICFSRLFAGQKPLVKMPDHFYKLIERTASENPKDRYWTKIDENMQRLVFNKVPTPEFKVELPTVKAAVTKLSPSQLKRKQKRQMNLAKLTKSTVLGDDAPILERGAEKNAIVRADPTEELVVKPLRLSKIEKVKPPKKEKKKERKDKSILGRAQSSLQTYLESVHIAMNPLSSMFQDSNPIISIPRASRPHALTYREHEPTHHITTAKALGYDEIFDFDSRDFLMVHLLIGQRIWRNIIKPLLRALEPYETELHMIRSFKKSAVDFRDKLDVLQYYDPETFSDVMDEANIQDISWLYKCLDYYQKRNIIAHPTIPDDFTALAARHISTLELNQAIDVLTLERMRMFLHCKDTVLTKKIVRNSRPSNFISPEDTETALATIWIHKAYQNEKIAFTRRSYAHKEVSDSVYHSYIEHIFKDHRDCNFLYDL